MSVATHLPTRPAAPRRASVLGRRGASGAIGAPTMSRPLSGSTLRATSADGAWALPGSAAAPTRLPRPAVLTTRPRRRPARLTRRGRVVIVLAALAVLLGLGFTLGRVGASHAAGATGPQTTTVVQPGETLWSIAARVAPNSDTRIVVARIEATNHLVDGNVQVGERLVLPS